MSEKKMPVAITISMSSKSYNIQALKSIYKVISECRVLRVPDEEFILNTVFDNFKNELIFIISFVSKVELDFRIREDGTYFIQEIN